MSMRLSSTKLALTLAGLMAMPACSSSDDSQPSNEGGTAGTLSTGIGGSTARGGSPSGGTSRGGAANGGAANGGTVSGGTAGSAATVAGSTNGGSATGGAPSNGGTQAGSTSAAGAATGGTPVTQAGSAGKATGGAATGGALITTAGTAGTATATGGAATGGSATGGASVTIAGSAGQATGGTATGGTATGGATGGLSGVAGYVSQLPPSCAADPRCSNEEGIEGSCCKSIEVPGGTFLRGRGTETCTGCQTGCPPVVINGSYDCYSDETPQNSATISNFKLDKYPVTVARMKKFMESYDTWRASNPVAGGGANPADPGTGYMSGWNSTIGGLNLTSSGYTTALGCSSGGTSTYTASGNDNFPANCINWVQAFAFCIWDGGRLPSEAEWEYAAAGGSENRLYPWGAAAPDSTRAVYGLTNALVNVGSKTAGAARWGHMDMAGLVWEWVFDTYNADFYDTPGCTDCSYYEVGLSPERVVRGGSYANSSDSGAMRSARRFFAAGNIIPVAAYGFRCAR